MNTGCIWCGSIGHGSLECVHAPSSPAAPASHYESASAAKEDADAFNAAERPEQVADAHDCTKCGRSVYVADGCEFNGNDGDVCWPCLADNYEALKQSLRDSRVVHTAILRGDIVLTKEAARHIAGIDYENEALKKSHAALMEELQSLVDTIEDAGGHDENGDVFDIGPSCVALANAKKITEGL